MNQTFTIMATSLSDKKLVQFNRLITTIKASLAAGSITNPIFNDTKSALNRLLDDAWEARISSRYTYAGLYRSLPPAVLEFYHSISYPQLHTITSVLNKVTTTKLAHPMIDDMRTFLSEMVPLQIMINQLKPMIVKRAAKTDQRDPRFVSPAASTMASKRVHALLTSVMADSYEGLVQALKAGMMRKLAAFQAAAKVAADNGKTLTLRGYAKQVRGADVNFLTRVTYDDRPRSLKVLISDDADQTITHLAKRHADELREMFIAKNLRKIVSIMDAKENSGIALSEIKVISRNISIGGFTGEFHAAFVDGSCFDFTNSIVWSQSVYGKVFNRFPLTFHNVRLANGEKMAQPSEERMNTIFVNRETTSG
jgi:hypothetical protein